MTHTLRIRCLEVIGEREIRGLSDVLIDSVEGGASVSFLSPMTQANVTASLNSSAVRAQIVLFTTFE